MKSILFILSITLFSSMGYAQNAVSLDAAEREKVQTTQGRYFPLLIDSHLSMRSGSENIITFHQGLALSEDKSIGTTWFSESSFWGKTGNVTARVLKYIVLDTPVDYFSIILAHEYFGHGARYRELNFKHIDYSYDLPPPYGPGGGYASLGITDPISNHELLAIWEGGIEIHSLINRNLTLQWMRDNTMNYRQASQYFWSFQILMRYIQETNENLADGTEENDPRAYIRILNAHAGYSDPTHLKMDVKELKTKMKMNTVNPFLYYSLFSLLKTYIWNGDASSKFPAVHFGAVSYLPCLRTGLTPFGLEYHFENYFRLKNKVSLVDISYGDETFFDAWGSIGVFIQNIYEPNNLSFDVTCTVWKQPEIQFIRLPPTSKKGGLGAAFSARGYFNFPGSKYPVSAILEIGYKSSGFLEGYDLDSSPILRVGLAFKNQTR